VGSAASAFGQLIELMASQNGMADTIIRQHADDGTGHCHRCTGGAQTGHYRWPCQTYLAAQRAAVPTDDPSSAGTT
jgi:hypothetical protein